MVAVRSNTYVDSVALMRLTDALRALPGITEAAALMATEANRALLADAGLLADAARDAGANDLVIAVRAETAGAGRAALVRAEELLASRPGVASRSGAATGAREDDVAPRSLLGAARRAGGTCIAVISVPGPYASAEAQQALSAGLHVFLFSDHVALEDEVALKRRAAARGLLVMGPECGTSLLDGVGFGFANRVRRGDIGLVGAAGTGLQEVTTLVHRLGGGVSHAIGTGGRDLDAAVGGLTTLQALAWLARDAGTRAIVLVSKPASSAVAERVAAAAAATGKPVIACLLGWHGAVPASVRAVPTLDEAARAAVETVGIKPVDLPGPRPDGARRSPGYILGLFTGGTLCQEAAAVVAGGPARGRVTLSSSPAGSDGDRFVDFGAGEHTRGRPHPIIDPGSRNAAVAASGRDAGVGVVLVDVVLGHAAHPDPAAALVPAIIDARAGAAREGRALSFVAHIVGTDEDPQRLDAQEATLREAGVLVCPTNRAAAALARALAREGR